MNLLDICREFRTAIEVVCDERGFSIKDRMHRFPGGFLIMILNARR